MSIREGRGAPRPDDLDPLDEPERWESLVQRIGEEAEPYLAGRRVSAGVLDIVARWARPALATAASLLVVATATALGRGGVATGPRVTTSEAVLAQAVMPTSFAGWVVGVSETSVAEMVVELESMEEVGR